MRVEPMPTNHRTRLANIRRFDQLVTYLRDEMGWPIDSDNFEEMTFEYSPEELGIDAKNAAKIQEIKRLRSLTSNQPWGIFFVKFEPKRLPVVALRRILGQVALKKRASANTSERQAWAADDLLFVSNYGEGDERHISFAHFSKPVEGTDLPTLKVLGWDNLDTPLHLDDIADRLTQDLTWPDNPEDKTAWRERWHAAFTVRHGEVITTSKQLSDRLAKLARTIRDRIETAFAIESENGPLTNLLGAFQTALVHDLDIAGFADMYAQTITYGLLSARITNPEYETADDIATHLHTNPFLKELMETFLHVGGRHNRVGEPGIDFDELGVSDVVELMNDPNTNIEAVVRDFGDRNPQEDPVIHFYEHFLAAYDKKQKVRRGVFYTPRPVVSYIVRSVDELLRTKFDLKDGLADTTTWGEIAKRHGDIEIPKNISPEQAFVQILDPATGTGTFLVEVIDLIHNTMVEKWKEQGNIEVNIQALWNDYVPKHLLPRLHGYELLMAPYAIAHLKIGLKLYETGYLFDSDERARVYLTNALEPASSEQITLDYLPALAHEVQSVNKVKNKQRFTVVIGNPPYSGLSANMGPWIDGLLKGQLLDNTSTASYYHVGSEPLGEKKVWLQDDYVKFIRLSQWLIDTTGHGVHGYISNHAYLDNPTFRGMRWSLMQSFDHIHVLDLHGNLKKKEITPDGGIDINVFDIQQGVAIGLYTKRNSTRVSTDLPPVYHSEFWGNQQGKYDRLLTETTSSMQWQEVDRAEPFYLFKPFDSTEVGDYNNWSAINEVMPVNVTGVVTARDGFVIDFDRVQLLERMRVFLDTQLTDQQVQEQLDLSENYAWRVSTARQELRVAVRQTNLEDLVASIQYRPFDERFIFWHPSVVWRPRTEVMPHMLAGDNLSIIFMRQVAMGDDYTHFGVSRMPVDNRAFYSNKGIMSFAPLYLYPNIGKKNLSIFNPWDAGKDGRTPNIDPGFVHKLEQNTGLVFITDGRGNLEETFGPEDVFAFIYAIFHSPEYRRRFEPSLKLDFPRVPIPGHTGVFQAGVTCGYELLAIHLLESSNLQNVSTTFIGPKNSEVGRVGWSDNTVWLDAGKTVAREAYHAIKPGTIGFQGVSEAVWKFHIGGYQVCHKWLKDRKGRMLSAEDIVHYQRIVVALNESIRIMAEIDEVIESHGGWPGAFERGSLTTNEQPQLRKVAETPPAYDIEGKKKGAK
ncbi:type ISP restriction/modification enzyme [Gemmatimonadota bacterium]